MEAVPTKETTPSLSKSFDECMRLFRTFLLALHDESCRVVRLKQVDVTEISDQCGRAKVWGDQMRADLPERARGSLDDALRHDDDLKGLVKSIFMRLSGLLRQATSIAERKYDPTLGSDQDSVSSVSADDSETSSGSDSDDGRQPRSARMPKVRLLVQQITDQIRSLYDLSSLLRRPRIADKYIRSVRSKSHTATSDTLPLMSVFSNLDESHIIEKVLQWRGLTKSGQNFSCENETPTQERHGLATDGVGDILWYCQRLARANTRRREQLQHWADHPYVSTQDVPTPARSLPVLVKLPVKELETKEESGSQASTLKPASFKFPFAGPKSTMSKQSFSTAAVSDVHDTKTNARPLTVYAATNVGQGRSNAVPDPPKAQDGKMTFPCPYCGITLESGDMQNRQSWKRHVFRDLRPYICTFEHCQNPDKLYVSRHEWIYHELQIHRRKYVCKDCPKTYSSRMEMSAHVQEHYGESISPAQLGVILDLCDQQDDGMSGEKEECLVCGEELSFLTLQGHLATHMEDIALFVLPNTQEGQDMGRTNDSVQARNLNSRGKRSDSPSKTSSLGFSAAGDHGQSPTDFSKLLASEGAGLGSKFTHWEVADDPEIASLKFLVQQLDEPDENFRHAAVKTLGSWPALPYEIIEAMGARLECQGHHGQTVLSEAARNGHEATFERLIEKGADFESIDRSGQSPLHLAAKNGNEAIVRMLLRIGADDQMKDKAGHTPLSLATMRGRKAIIQLLQQHADSSASHQSSETYYSTLRNARDVTAGISLVDIDLDSLPPLYKKVGQNWHAIFNPQLQRDLDVDLVHVFEHALPVRSVRFSHDSMHIATGSYGTARIFDIQTGERVCALDHSSQHAGQTLYITNVSFSPDGHCLATGAGDMVYLWDIKSGTIIAHLEGHEDMVKSIEFSPDGKSIISGGDETVRLWDVDTRTNTRTVPIGNMVLSAAFSPDMQLIALGSHDEIITILETSTGERLMHLGGSEGHIASVYSVAFSHDSRTLVSGSLDRTIKMWDLDMPAQTQSHGEVRFIKTLQGHKGPVDSVAFTPDGNGLLSGSRDRSLQFWDPKTGMAKFLLRCHSSSIFSVAVSPRGGIFATASADGKARVWSYGPYQAEGT